MTDSTQIKRAAEALIQGHLVAIPTETVYGLAANATDEHAIARIYSVKGRPSNHPLIVHVSSFDAIHHWAHDIPEYVHFLARDFWPGPMTLVLKRSELAQDFVTGGQDTVAVRVPAHPVANELLREYENLGGFGIAAPSANRFGKVSPTSAKAVHTELGAYLEPTDLILDGGSSAVGIESTIIDCTGEAPRVLRLGAVTPSMIVESAGLRLSHEESTIRVSGSLKSHYSPDAAVTLDVEPQPGDGLIALSKFETPAGVTRVAAPKTVTEYAAVLYSALRRADELGLARLVAITPKDGELALAIVDRLQRASHK